MPLFERGTMPEEYDDDLLKEGILHFRSKNFSLARSYFERALSVADDLQTRMQANFYLSQVVEDPRQKRQFLEETLAIDMGHAGARRALAILDGKLDPAQVVNPETHPAPDPFSQAAPADCFTCPKCGGRMLYTPDGVALVCENCITRQDLDTGTPASGQDFFVAMANGTGFHKSTSFKTFQCQGCAANFLLDPSKISANCAYCGSVHVIAMQGSRELAEPDAIIPLAVDREKAALLLVQWMDGKGFHPPGRVESLRGLYLPVWSFDLIGSLPWSGQVIRNKRAVPLSGENPAVFNNICIPASRRLAGFLHVLLSDYSLATAPAYDPRFLAGWPAEVYELTMAEAALEARRLCVERLHRDIQAGQGNVIDLRYSTSALSITSYRLILVPIWVIDSLLVENTLRVVINGQTGTVLAEKPGHAGEYW
jgi:DNA-directed RNA polymerase subunit RPC12/RpoP